MALAVENYPIFCDQDGYSQCISSLGYLKESSESDVLMLVDTTKAAVRSNARLQPMSIKYTANRRSNGVAESSRLSKKGNFNGNGKETDIRVDINKNETGENGTNKGNG